MVEELTPDLCCSCDKVCAKPTLPGKAKLVLRAEVFASFGLTNVVLTSALGSTLKFILRSTLG
jgi:hypothetical protein